MFRPLLAGAACLALLTACNDRGASPAVDKAQDMAAAPVGQTSAATIGANTIDGYVPAAAMGDMYEIQAATIALRRSTNASVTTYPWSMASHRCRPRGGPPGGARGRTP